MAGTRKIFSPSSEKDITRAIVREFAADFDEYVDSDVTIIGAGPSISVPPSLAGKLLGAKVIHVESASRVTRPSLTGRLLYPVADLFFVQWEGLLERFPRARYAGRLW